jgi:hypothetical protein
MKHGRELYENVNSENVNKNDIWTRGGKWEDNLCMARVYARYSAFGKFLCT